MTSSHASAARKGVLKPGKSLRHVQAAFRSLCDWLCDLYLFVGTTVNTRNRNKANCGGACNSALLCCHHGTRTSCRIFNVGEDARVMLMVLVMTCESAFRQTTACANDIVLVPVPRLNDGHDCCEDERIDSDNHDDQTSWR